MSTVIAVCGKGGVGKTTLAALFARLMLEQRSRRALFIDADPAGGLTLALGLPVKQTVDGLRRAVVEAAASGRTDPRDLAASLEYRLLDALTERGNLAFLAVGRPEEAGCYCRVNELLRESVELLAHQFDLTVIDAEAGLEQVNRRVIGRADLLLLVSDHSARGLRVAEGIAELARRSARCRETGLVLNRVTAAEAEAAARNTALPLLGRLPEDEEVRSFDHAGRSLLLLPTRTPSLQSAEILLKRHI